MKLKWFIYISVLLASVALAEGPVFQHKDPVAQQEFENVYKDLRGVAVSSGTYIQNRASLQSGATFFVSSGTVTGALAVSTLTINGNSLRATAGSRTLTIPDNGGTAFVMLTSTRQQINGGRPLGPRIVGLKVSRQSNSTNHLLWDYVVLTDTNSNVFVEGTSGSLVLTDISVNGAVNSLDTGAVAANSWYYLWIISNGTTTGGLYSLSTSTPVMPSGYTYKMLVGAQRTDAGANLIEGAQIDDTFYWGGGKAVISNMTTGNGVTQAVDISTFVPPLIAWDVEMYSFLIANYSVAGAKDMTVTIGRHNGSAKIVFDVNLYENATSLQMSGTSWVPIYNESVVDDKVDWTFTSNSTNRSSYSAYLYVNSYRISILF